MWRQSTEKQTEAETKMKEGKRSVCVCAFLLFHYSTCFSHQFCMCVCVCVLVYKEVGRIPYVISRLHCLYIFFVFPLFPSKANSQRLMQSKCSRLTPDGIYEKWYECVCVIVCSCWDVGPQSLCASKHTRHVGIFRCCSVIGGDCRCHGVVSC